MQIKLLFEYFLIREFNDKLSLIAEAAAALDL